MKILDDVKKQRTDIQTDSYSISWGELINMYRDDELKIDPEYQRLFRWSQSQQTQFIESIILDIPTPAIFLAQNENSKHEVIDGLQRISTLLKFFAPVLFGKDAGKPSNNDNTINNIKIPSILAPGPLLPSLNGYHLGTLPESLTINIKRARLPVIFLKKESSPKSRYEVFRRVNTYGTKLEPQEIRNCTARILGSEFPNALAQLASIKAIQDSFGFDDERIQRRSVEEMLLRLLAFNYSEKSLIHDVSAFLDEFMEYASEGKFNLNKEVSERVLKTFTLINSAFSNGDAFKYNRKNKPSGAFSTNIYDIVASGIFKNVEHLTKEKLLEKHKTLLNSDELKEFVGAGSNTRKKTDGRIQLGIKWFKK